jgi:hypothetical protein
MIVQTRKKQEDLEFQLMELETRCETELEQAEEHFQSERLIVTQNAQSRQVLVVSCRVVSRVARQRAFVPVGASSRIRCAISIINSTSFFSK